MKQLITISLLTICFFLTTTPYASANGILDTIPVKHTTDAVLDDWDPASFDVHDLSGIHMAIENDSEKLYIGLYVTNKEVQRKLALAGMRMMIDIKGKKKENTYIEFPLQKDPQTAALALAETENTEKSIPDQLAKHMLFLKKKAFKNQLEETEIQAIASPSDMLLSFGWDEKSVLYMEYEIPFQKLADYTTLKNKEITVGFRINALEVPIPEPKQIITTTTLIAVPAGSVLPSNLRTNGNNRLDKNPANKTVSTQQSFWMKHQIN